MRHQGTAAVGLIAALAMVLGGCGFFTKTGLEAVERIKMLQPQSAGKAEMETIETIDDLFVKVAQRVPEFGGMFLDENDNNFLYVYLLDLTKKAAVEAAIAAAFGAQRIPRGGIRVIQGKYSFLELKSWYDRMWMELVEAIPGGVTLTDIDDARNRLLVWVIKLELQERVEQELVKSSIPREAVIIEQAGPVELDTTLRDRVRPLVGGIQIFPYFCTLGFNAIRSGVSGFATNSHCTDQWFVVDGTVHHQPVVFFNVNRIGIETIDPPLYTGGGCPSGRQCRQSDSAFAQLSAGVTSSLGFIARPAGLGSIRIVGNFRIVDKSDPMVGQIVERVGRSSGWRRGNVTNVCIDIHDSHGPGITMRCQFLADYYSEGGDSGSPVFTILNSQHDVRLNGIHWGQISQSGVLRRIFSGIWNVQIDLGALLVCAAGFDC
jgi:hypothetical protein